jgi:glycosyltransferase involved in cell wall biosynthesis
LKEEHQRFLDARYEKNRAIIMKIAVVTTIFPIRPEEAGAPRVYCLARELCKRHDISLILCPLGAKKVDPSAGKSLGDIFTDFLMLPGPPKPPTLGKWRHRLHNAPSQVWEYRCPSFVHHTRKKIHEFLKQRKISVLWCDGLGAVQFVPEHFPAVIDLCDSLTLLYERQYAAAGSLKERLNLFLAARSYRRYEREIGQRFPHIVLISERDAEAFCRLTPASRPSIIPIGVDTDYFSPLHFPRENRSGAIFFGVLSYPPNRDAAHFLIQDILPLLRKRRPDIPINIVGKSPEKPLLDEAHGAGVRVYPDVPDIRPYLADAAIFICPLRFGAGIKNKILSAIAMNLPIVATSLAVEGIGLTDGVDCLLGDTREKLAEDILNLLDHPEKSADLAKNARRLLQAKFSWSHCAAAAEAALLKCAAHPN